MVYTKWKLEHTPFREGSYQTGDTSDITSFFDPVLESNLGEGRDMFKFKVQNNRGQYNNFFRTKDKITVYRKVNSSSFTSDDIVMVAAVEKVPYKNASNINVMNVDCYNYSESVMGAIVFVDANTLSADEAIQTALAQINTLDTNFSVIWDTDPSQGSTTQLVGKRYFYKTALSMIEELSQDKYTGDGRYFWYINNENKFIWKKDSAYNTGEFDSLTTPYRAMGTKIDTAKIINYIISKGGILPDGRQVQDYIPDFASIARNGYKYHIETSHTTKVSELVKEDLDAEVTATTDGYPDLTGSFTSQWDWTGEDGKEIEGVTLTANSTVTINLGSESANKIAYNEILKAQVIVFLRKEANELLAVRSKGKFILEIETLPGQETWGLGDSISCTVPEIFQDDEGNTASKNLRVQEYQLTTDSDIIELEEDTGSV